LWNEFFFSAPQLKRDPLDSTSTQMTRPVELTLWVLSAILAAAFFLLSGFYGWATILVWTVLVAPLTWRRHRQAALVGARWPPQSVVLPWGLALVLSLAAGVVPQLLPSSPTADASGWLAAALSWAALILSLGTILLVTYDASRQGARAV